MNDILQDIATLFINKSLANLFANLFGTPFDSLFANRIEILFAIVSFILSSILYASSAKE